MSITCVFILNHDFTDLFSPMKIDIFKNFGLKSWKMMLIMEIGKSILSQTTKIWSQNYYGIPDC